MRILIVDSDTIDKVISYSYAIDVVEEAFKNKEIYGVELPPRQEITLDAPQRFYGSMAVYLHGYNIIGVKLITYFFENQRLYGISPLHAFIAIFDGMRGYPIAFVEGSRVTTYRTGAMGALSSKYLSKSKPSIIGLIGAGIQGNMQLRMHLQIYPGIDKILIYDLRNERSKNLREQFIKEYDKEIIECSSVDDVVKMSDILILATTSLKPVINGGLLKNGVHIVSIGYINKDSRELDDETFKRADKVYVDSKDAISSGDIRIPLENGSLDKKKIIGELSKLVIGRIRGRESNDEITVFKSVGTAVLDAAMAYKVYLKALEQGEGMFIKL